MKRIKLVIGTLLCILFGALLLTNCSSPCELYAQRVLERSSVHFPRYEYLIDTATLGQLEFVLGLPSGSLLDSSNEDIRSLKDSLCLEIKGWGELIKTEAQVQNVEEQIRAVIKEDK